MTVLLFPVRSPSVKIKIKIAIEHGRSGQTYQIKSRLKYKILCQNLKKWGEPVIRNTALEKSRKNLCRLSVTAKPIYNI